jgi:outer membrane protein assembly factor BamB
LFFLIIFISVSEWFTSPVWAGDWFQWRGPEQNGVSRETNLPQQWSPDVKDRDSNLIWKVPYGGRSTPIVMNGRVYLINSAGAGETEQERVVCLDAESGKLLWEHRFNVFLTDIVSARVGWTNVAGDPETGNVYAHGVQGLLFCIDGKTGKVLWSHSLTEEYGRISGYGGRVTTPIIDGNLLLLGMINASWGEFACGGNRFVAMDKRTGAIIWWSETGYPVRDTYYSCPVVAVINGQRLLISGGGDGGVHAFQVATGKKVWSYLIGAGAVNSTPVVHGDRVYIGHGEENLDSSERGRLVCLDGAQVQDGKPKLVWEHQGVLFKYPSPILHAPLKGADPLRRGGQTPLLEGRLMICDDSATLYCYDAESGKELWTHSYGRNAKGSPVWADGKVYVAAVNGQFSVLKPGEDSCEVLSQFTIPSRIPRTVLQINGTPAVANGRIYFMTSQDLYCLGKQNGQSTAAVDPPGTREADSAPDARPSLLQVVPADVVLAPGGSTCFRARMYDASGRFLRETQAAWAVTPSLAPPPLPGQPAPPGPSPSDLQGRISADGTLTVARTPGQYGGVVATAEGLTGRARVRVAPQPPYVQDFEKVQINRTPDGWLNAQGKFAVREWYGSHVLVKLATNPSPLMTRSHLFITMPQTGPYTIETEVMGARKGAYLPDMGVVNSSYTLQLAGAYQQLRLLSWDAQPRIDRSISFPWKADIWYVLKLKVEPQEGRALIRGKVWERSKPEPADWTVTVADPAPNLEGSAGLFGNTTGVVGPEDPGTEIYYDNVTITGRVRSEE